jgi:hypothetical protein
MDIPINTDSNANNFFIKIPLHLFFPQAHIASREEWRPIARVLAWCG